MPRSQHLHVGDVQPQDLVQSPDLQQTASAQDGDAIAERLRVGQDVGGEEHGLAPGLQVQDDVAHQAAPEGIEAGHGLVEEDHLGIVHEGLGQPRALDHPLGEAPQRQVGGPREAHEVQQVPGAGAAGFPAEAEEPPHVVEILPRGEVVVEVGVFGKVADLEPPGAILPRPPQDLDRPPLRPEQAHEDLQGRGLARSVGTQVAENLAPRDFESQVDEHRSKPAREEVTDRGRTC